jgi:serine protease Do
MCRKHLYVNATTILLRVLFLAVVISAASSAWCGNAFAAAAPDTFANLAEKQGPTVVNIYTTQTVKEPSSLHRFLFPDNNNIPEPFRRFFDMPFGPDNAPPREFKRTSLGSGVITSPDGYILTNNHVVKDADEINVRLSTFDEYEAKIIGRDPKSDLALIKIDAKSDLPYAVFGDSDKLRVGDWVMAVGNPFGLEQTVTAGIVSAKGRSIGNEGFGNFIQTDASINPGNSGGALFNLKGEMVGVNTAIFSQSGGNIGIGFAIPVNMAKDVLQQLKETGKVIRGWLGVMIQQVTPDLAKNFGLERPIGALVGEVNSDSPAEEAGIKQGDVIIKYDGKVIYQMSMLPAMVAQTPVGEKVKIVLIRDGKEMEVTAKIGVLKEEEVAEEETEAVDEGSAFGLTVQAITQELADSLKLKDREGVLIANVEPNSPADDAGLQRGDIILEINRQPVPDKEAYNEMMQELKTKKESILLLIKRGSHMRFVVLTPEK